MSDLTQKKCIPCESGMSPMTKEEVEKMLTEVSSWQLKESSGHLQINREFTFKDFKQALAFVNQVADLADSEGHHPDIHIHYNKVNLVLWTHTIAGLSENDFIMAAKVNQLTG